jgi:hypothetical protein
MALKPSKFPCSPKIQRIPSPALCVIQLLELFGRYHLQVTTVHNYKASQHNIMQETQDNHKSVIALQDKYRQIQVLTTLLMAKATINRRHDKRMPTNRITRNQLLPYRVNHETPQALEQDTITHLSVSGPTNSLLPLTHKMENSHPYG